MAKIIAAKVDSPSSPIDPFDEGGMLDLNRTQAAHVLTVAGTTSLAYGTSSPSKGRINDTMEALRQLAGDAIFVGNGLWDIGRSQTWTPLTSATFDCGVIGFDAENAFIFWVEEED